MSGLEKFLLVITLLLAIAMAAIILMPDASGQSGVGSLSTVIDRASEFLLRTLDSVGFKLAAWADRVETWARGAVSPPGVGVEQGNPVDSAVNPVGSYGEEQKDEFGKPLEGLQP